MKHLTKAKDYNSPKTEVVDIVTESVLCQSGNEPGFTATLEGLSEQGYTFGF